MLGGDAAAAAAAAAASASIRIHTSYAVVDLLATQVAKDLFSSMLLVVLRVYTNCVLMLKR